MVLFWQVGTTRNGPERWIGDSDLWLCSAPMVVKRLPGVPVINQIFVGQLTRIFPGPQIFPGECLSCVAQENAVVLDQKTNLFVFLQQLHGFFTQTQSIRSHWPDWTCDHSCCIALENGFVCLFTGCSQGLQALESCLVSRVRALGRNGIPPISTASSNEKLFGIRSQCWLHP